MNQAVKDCKIVTQARIRAEGYNEFFERCEKNAKKGLKQELCKHCLMYKWPDERCSIFAAIPEKPRFRLHVGVNPLGYQFWWVSRGNSGTLDYNNSADAVAASALVLRCE